MLMDFSTLTVKARLSIGFGSLVLLLGAIAALGLARMASIEARLESITQVNMHKMELVNEMEAGVQTVQRVLRTMLLVKDPAEAAREVEKIAKARAEYDASMAKLGEMPATPSAVALLDAAKAAHAVARPVNDQIIDMARAGQRDEAVELLLSKGLEANRKWTAILVDGARKQRLEAEAVAADARASYESARNMVLALAVVALAAAAAAGYLITRSLTRQLGGEPGYAADVASRIADGDLAIDIEVAPGDTTSMLFAMKRMRDRLGTIVSEVRNGTDMIASAATQIATGNLDLSSRTEEQASSLEETASSMEELTSTVKQNADHAREANTLAVDAAGVAEHGGEEVAGVVRTMDEINSSSGKIVEIISVIDGIAFQTNILALNAAVEAARAGEQGRGFAVVAGEVRTLAQRSAGAAKEIKALIDQSVANVAIGAEQAGKAGRTMERVVHSVQRVVGVVGEISAASAEQSAGIDEMNQAISQMDAVTQQNSALVEEAAAASQALQEQAARLAQLVSTFRLPAQETAAGLRVHQGPRQVGGARARRDALSMAA
ncbi:MAG: methyl-accepting chemotaxis protein [Telluria sp.]